MPGRNPIPSRSANPLRTPVVRITEPYAAALRTPSWLGFISVYKKKHRERCRCICSPTVRLNRLKRPGVLRFSVGLAKKLAFFDAYLIHRTRPFPKRVCHFSTGTPNTVPTLIYPGTRLTVAHAPFLYGVCLL